MFRGLLAKGLPHAYIYVNSASRTVRHSIVQHDSVELQYDTETVCVADMVLQPDRHSVDFPATVSSVS